MIVKSDIFRLNKNIIIKWFEYFDIKTWKESQEKNIFQILDKYEHLFIKINETDVNAKEKFYSDDGLDLSHTLTINTKNNPIQNTRFSTEDNNIEIFLNSDTIQKIKNMISDDLRFKIIILKYSNKCYVMRHYMNIE